ncbi:hypothetical protein CS053_03720 [Rhodanobacter glycinis]|uniref:Uncharacterized protein n=1 Tax=Rhodanobacter glycinis TaxID=582702 RepID=A0A5B9DWK1_9GAMM|nr:hypothetical protein [Rhodanobacter glycinis]QEE23718.1 hypothetical protein CS053_03720 [Rhodanobacter glycinis]
MRRLLLTLPLLLLPLVAAGQSLGGSSSQTIGDSLLQTPPAQTGVRSTDASAVPLWRGANGHVLSVQSSAVDASEAEQGSPLSFRGVDAGTVASSSLNYGLAPHLTAHAGVSEHSWANRAPRVVGSEVGASYNAGRYSVGLSVGANGTSNSPTLPRVLPGATPSVNGLSDFDSSTQFNARGRMSLGSGSGIDIGASVGRIRLLPGNALGLNTLDQKALSFGVDHGSISGNIIGRVMQPEAGVPGALSGDHRWSSIDLGVTWHLPWQGSLSFGAQNVWSSGNAANTPVGPEPDQSRTPYVQYHQDL